MGTAEENSLLIYILQHLAHAVLWKQHGYGRCLLQLRRLYWFLLKVSFPGRTDPVKQSPSQLTCAEKGSYCWSCYSGETWLLWASKASKVPDCLYIDRKVVEIQAPEDMQHISICLPVACPYLLWTFKGIIYGDNQLFSLIFWFILKPVPGSGSGSLKSCKMPAASGCLHSLLPCTPWWLHPGCRGLELPLRAADVGTGVQLLAAEQGLDWSTDQGAAATVSPSGSHFWSVCFVLNPCCRKLLQWQRKKPVRLRSASWTGRKMQGKFHGTDQTCTTRSQTQSLFRKGVAGIFWILAEIQGAHDTQLLICSFIFFFLFKQNWSFSEKFLREVSQRPYVPFLVLHEGRRMLERIPDIIQFRRALYSH